MLRANDLISLLHQAGRGPARRAA